jgi:hypothetical protein
MNVQQLQEVVADLKRRIEALEGDVKKPAKPKKD